MTKDEMIEWFKSAPKGSRHERMLWAARKIARLTQRQSMTDDGFHPAGGSMVERRCDILLGIAVRAEDLQFAHPDKSHVVAGVKASGRAAGQKFSPALECAQRRNPSVAARVVHDHVDAALSGQGPGLPAEILLGIVDGVVGASLPELLALVLGPGRCDDAS